MLGDGEERGEGVERGEGETRGQGDKQKLVPNSLLTTHYLLLATNY